MTWSEAEAAVERGSIVRRPVWAEGTCLGKVGERLVLRRLRRRTDDNAGWSYNPSMEAMKATDWEIAG